MWQNWKENNLSFGEIEMFVGEGIEDAFICNVNGCFTLDQLSDIEEEFTEEPSVPIPDGMQFIIFTPKYIEEKQYNNADCLNMSYWYFDNIKFSIE